MANRTFLGTLRLVVLLMVLGFVALGAWLDSARSRDWDASLRLTIYPIAASPTAAVRSYVDALQAEDFAEVASFLQEQAEAYDLPLAEPVHVRVSHAVTALPPQLDGRPGMLQAVWWSLRMRYWAASVAWNDPLPDPDVQLFALYYPGDNARPVPDSVGLRKGLIAVAHLYADRGAAATNRVVVAHEFLHTLGATDKYDPATGAPLVPAGLGDPDSSPVFPQSTAEIMAGRIAMSTQSAVMPDALSDVVVGSLTAREIGWLP